MIVLAATTLAVVSLWLAADRLTRDPPNYSEVENGLWLGGAVAEPPAGTRAVLNLCEAEDPYHTEADRWEPIPDAAPPPSLDWLRAQVGFIEAQRAAGRPVYVHCRNGVSRSGLVVVAYYMAREGWSRSRALEFVRSWRPAVRPNPVFLQLLSDWERGLGAGAGAARPDGATDRAGS